MTTKLSLLAVLLLPSVLLAQNFRVDGVVQSRSGLPAPGALVAVCSQPATTATAGTITNTPCTPLINLCSSVTDLVCNQPNPVTADGLGNFFYYAPPGLYTYQIYGSTLAVKILPDQPVGLVGSSSSGSSSPQYLYLTNSPICTTANSFVELDTTNTDASGNATAKTASLGSKKVIGVALSGAGCSGTVTITTSLTARVIADNQTVVGDWVSASPSALGQADDYGAAKSTTVQTVGIVSKANTGPGTLTTIIVGTGDQLSNGSSNSNGSVANSGCANALPYYATTGNAVSPDCNFTSNGSGTVGVSNLNVNGGGTGVVTLATGTPPSNPPSGKVSLYGDSTTGLLTCLNSSGAPCFGTQGVLNASACSGADLGAKINSCDALLGANPGTIWVTKSGTISTAAVLCASGNNHTLYIMGGVTVTEGTSLNTPLSMAVGSSGCRITGDGPSSTIFNASTLYNGGTFNGDLITVGSKVSQWNSTVYTNLAVNAAENATTIQVGNSTGCATGQDVVIKENGTPGPYRYSEFNVVASVPDGTHITLLTGTEHAYRAVLTANNTTVACFAPGTLTKNWEVSNIHLQGNLTGMSTTGPNSGVGSYVAVDGYVSNIWADGLGGRGVLVGASGYPAARVSIVNTHMHDVGLVPSGNGTTAIECYSQTSHCLISGNIITRTGAHGITIHGFYSVVNNNVISWAAIGNSGYAGISSDTAGEVNSISNNTISNPAGPGIILFGAVTALTTEVNRTTVSGNIIKAPGGDCIDVGTTGSPGNVKGIVVSGNQCINPRGSNGILLEGNNGGYIANVISNNHIEGATNCINLGQTNLGPTIAANDTTGCGTALNLNSPLSAIFIGNHDDGTSTTGIALGTADFSTFIANHGFGTITGTFGTSSTVIGQRTFTNQLPTGAQTFNVQNPLQASQINSAAGTLAIDLSNAPTVAGFNSGSVTNNTGAGETLVTVGSGTAGSTGTMNLFLSAAHGWHCSAENSTRAALILQTSSTTTTAVLTNFGTTFTATNWTNGDVLRVRCAPE